MSKDKLLVWPEQLDSQEFYDLMQAYRTTPVYESIAVNAAYEAVMFYIRDKIYSPLKERIEKGEL